MSFSLPSPVFPYNLRQMDSFRATEWSRTSVSGTTSLSLVPYELSMTKEPQKYAVTGRSIWTSSKVCPRGSQSTSRLRILLVLKKNGETRYVLDLSFLNHCLVIPHFKMKTSRSIRIYIHTGMWKSSLHLTDDYSHVPLLPSFRKFLRLVWDDKVYAFKATPFGLSTTPLVFTNIFSISDCSSPFPVNLYPFVSGRLLDQESFFLPSASTHSSSNSASVETWFLFFLRSRR
jgi:hypothetical protein